MNADKFARFLSATCFGIAGPMLVSGRAVFFALVGIGALSGLYAQRSRVPSIAGAVVRSARSALGQAVLLFILFLGIATVNSIDPAGSIVILGRVIVTILATVLLAHGFAGDDQGRRTAMMALVIAAPLGGALAIVGLQAWPGLFEMIRGYDPSEDYALTRLLKPYGIAMVIMAPVVVWAAMRKGGAWIVVAVGYPMLALWVSWLVDNKSSVLGAAGAVGGLVICGIFMRLSAAAARGAALAVVAAITLVLFIVFSRLPEYPASAGAVPGWPEGMIDYHRQFIWSFALERIGERPLLGWGPGTTGRLPGARDTIPALAPAIYAASHPHNWILQVLVEAGSITLLLLVLVILLFARHIVRIGARGSGAAYAAAATAGGFFASNLVNFSVFSMWWLLLLVLMLSIPLAAGRRETGNAETGAG